MASRRRYKIQEYRDGGAVPLTSGGAIPEVVEHPEVVVNADEPSLPPRDADDPIQKALMASFAPRNCSGRRIMNSRRRRPNGILTGCAFPTPRSNGSGRIR